MVIYIDNCRKTEEYMEWKYTRYSTAAILLVAVLAVKAQVFTAVQRPLNHVHDNSADPKFKVDTAKLIVNVNTSDGSGKLLHPVSVNLLSDYCHECSYYNKVNISGIHHHTSKTFLIDTRWGTNVLFKTFLENSNISCNDSKWFHFGERGEYSIVFTVNDVSENGSCHVTELQTTKKPINSYLPILVAFLILLALALCYTFADHMYSKRTPERTESVERFINSDLGSLITPGTQDETPPPEPKPSRERLKSVDSFRGLCIVIMIFVNYKGGRYWFFHHAAWHGLTVADLVFPWFMFIMGINIVMSIDSLIRRATPCIQIFYKIIRRTLILFFLGLCIINHSTDFATMRIPGVLQRFAVAYLVVTILQWGFHKPVPDMVSIVVMASSDDDQKPWWYHVRDIVVYWPQWLIIFALEATWTFLTFMLPVPGCPTGYLGPGGLSENGKHFNCTGGAAAYIDVQVFGINHIYGHTTAKAIYFPTFTNEQKINFDPEGLLGTIHSCLIVFLGLQAGKIFLYYKEPAERIKRWFAWSLFLGIISAILTKCSQFDGWIPVNKNLWSTSFVTTLSCMAFFILPVMYYIIDVKKWWTGVPLYYVGMNSILLYVGHEVFQDFLPFSWGAGATSTHGELLAMNMLGTAYWVIIAYYCYKINFFVKI